VARLLIYGANGYTGRLIAHGAAALGIDAVLAGRDEAAVGDVARQLDLRSAAFALDDGAALDAALRDCTAVLHCAGPFAYTSRPMADACLRRGVHYLDITGEIAVFEALAARHDEARRAGVMLLPGVGFDVVPSDCLAAYLATRVDNATSLSLAIRATCRISRGTARSSLLQQGEGGCVRRGGTLRRVPAAWRTRRVDFGDGPQKAVTIPWGDVATAWYSTGIPDIAVYAALPATLRAAIRVSRYLAPVLRSPAVQAWQMRAVQRRPPGPSARELRDGSSVIWGSVENERGESVEARVHGPNAYRMTADASLEIARRVLAGQVRPGFATPALAYGVGLLAALPETSLVDAAGVCATL
jgi:short subunit dehydrogenase-like uncharacterized protein